MRHTRSKSANERRERQWEHQESVVSEREREAQTLVSDTISASSCCSSSSFLALSVFCLSGEDDAASRVPKFRVPKSCPNFRSQKSSPNLQVSNPDPNFSSQFQIPKLKSPRCMQVTLSDPKTTQVPNVYVGHTFRSQNNSSPQGVCRSHFQIPKQLKSPKCRSTLSDPKTTQVPKVSVTLSNPKIQVPKCRSQTQIPEYRS